MNTYWVTFDTDAQLDGILNIINHHNNTYECRIIDAKEYLLKTQYTLQPGARVLVIKQDTTIYICDTDIFFEQQLRNIGLFINVFTSTGFLSRLNYSSEILHDIIPQYIQQ